MKKFIAQAEKGRLKMDEKTREAFLIFLDQNEGEYLEIHKETSDTKASRGFLFAPVCTIYAEHKYNIPRKMKGMAQTRKYLFMRDFNSNIVTSKDGEPVKIPKESSKGLIKELLQKFNEWAIRDMCPVPNTALYKKWDKEWSSDLRWETYYDWLEYLGLEVDAMPTDECFKKLYQASDKIEYPKEEFNPKF